MAKSKSIKVLMEEPNSELSIPEFKIIPVSSIKVDENQPRKFFDQTAHNELVNSVMQKGVLQPILVRTWNCDTTEQTYLLVCGERRFRASKEAGLATIPAMIRTLTDEEALELQIIENLQRKDVHPMEEAVAFKSLEERGIVLKEIAARIGKSATFVTQRIKLTDLIEDFQQMLFQNKMKLYDAIKLSRLESEFQEDIFKELTKYHSNWMNDDDFSIEEDIDDYIKEAQHDLTKAPFDLADALLYPGAGSCRTCLSNSANTPYLFPELNEFSVCSNSVCYKIKCDRNYQQTIEKVMSDPAILFVSIRSYNQEDKAKIKAAKDMGVNVLTEGEFRTILSPEHPGSIEDYLKENDHWTMDDNYDADEKKEYEDECRSDYASLLSDYEEEVKEQAEALESGRVKKAFVVTGGYRVEDGSIINIILKQDENTNATDGSVKDNSVTSSADIEIKNIQDRENRNKELDSEKVHDAVQDILSKSKNFLNPKRDCKLTEAELMTIPVVLFYAGSYGFKAWMKEQYDLSERYSLNAKDFESFKGTTDFGINEMLRHFIHDQLLTGKGIPASRLVNAKAAAVHALALENEPMSVNKAMIDQEGIAANRAEKVQKRIAALKNKSKE